MENAKRIDCITGLKGAACLIMMTNHFAGLFLGQWRSVYKSFPISALFNGTALLYLFYVLSAFLIASAYFRQHSREKLQKQLLLRAPRFIIPVFFACGFVMLLQALNAYAAFPDTIPLTGTLRSLESTSYGDSYTVYHWIKTSIFSVFTRTTDFTFVLWMLPALYYGFFVTVIWMLSTDALPLPLSFMLTVVGTFFTMRFLESETYAAFLFGTFLAALYTKHPGFFTGHTPWKTGLAALCAALALYLLTYLPGMEPTGALRPLALLLDKTPYADAILYTVFAVCTLAATLYFARVQRFFSLRPLLFLGELSMTVFLFHDPIQATLGCHTMVLLSNLTGSYALSVIGTYLVCAAAVLLIAYPVHRFLEKPALRLADRAYGRILARTERNAA